MKLVAGLFRIPQKAPHDGKGHYTGKQGSQGEGGIKVQSLQYCIPAEDSDKGGAQVPYKAHENSQKHKTRLRALLT